MMHKKQKPKVEELRNYIAQFPHCDARILHAPGECVYCDQHPDWQALRASWGIAFTGWTPDEKELPCPADHARGNTHTKWGGNVARPENRS
jgi:hypothetical protein